MKKDEIKVITITILLFILLINCFYKDMEHFDNSCPANLNNSNNQNGSEDNEELILPNLDNIDIMSNKIDELADDEKETRMFCKILRHDSNNKKQIENLIETRNKQFQDNLDKQNKMLCQIKSKIVNYKLNKDNKEFTDFNNKKNKEREALKIRHKIMAESEKHIRKGPVLNLKINDKYTSNFTK